MDDKTHDNARAHWNAAAADFDDEPDHGLRDPAVREAWRAALALLPPALARATVHDLTPRPDLWGRPAHDERYARTADRG